MKILTVAIPTRNRFDLLKRQIESLSPQITDEVEVVIIDNNSEKEVQVATQFLIDNHYSKYIFIKNKFNIGGDANFLRCFDYCTTTWLLTLGDSRLISNNAIQVVLENIKRNQEASFVNFFYASKYHGIINKELFVDTQADFLDKVNSFGNILLTGNTVYRISAVQEYIKNGYSMLSSHAPQIAIMYCALYPLNSYGVLSPSQIIGLSPVKWKDTLNLKSLPFSVLDTSLSFPLLTCLALDSREFIKLSNLINGIDGKPSQPFAWILYGSLKNFYVSKDGLARIIYKRIIYLNFQSSFTRLLFYYYLLDFLIFIPFSSLVFRKILRHKSFIKSLKILDWFGSIKP